MTYRVQPLVGGLDARIRPPGSKSYTNRALVLAALAHGDSTLEGALFSDDTQFMAEALRQLGISIREEPAGQRFHVTGCGGVLPTRSADVNIGNAGTAARFLTSMMALGHGTYRLDGNEAMRTRPIAPLLEALERLGGQAKSLRGNGCPPVEVTARGLEGGTARLPGGVSSQYFSALLMVGPYTKQGITLEVEGELVSKPYLEVTAQAMDAFGAKLSREAFRRFSVPPGAYRGTQYSVEPDASAASYFFAAAAIAGGRVVVPGLGRHSLQGDLRFVQLLAQMGCKVRQDEHETEVVGPSRLKGIDVDMADLSDTAQTLAVVAPFADGPTRVRGIGFIRRKETNRVAAVVTELQRLGIQAVEESDGFLIHPGTPKAGQVHTYDDHRMAMSFSLLGLKVPGIEIQNPGCVAKTFPNFFEAFALLQRGM